MRFLNFAAIFSLVICNIYCVSYDGYKVYKVIPETPQQADFVHNLRNENKYDFWSEGRTPRDPSNVMVAPEDQAVFETYLKHLNVAYEVVIDNVERLIQQERIERVMTRTALRTGQVTFNSYMLYSEQMAYLRSLQSAYPNIVQVTEVGESYEGRPLLLLSLSSGPSAGTTPKPAIFIDAGIHCREWIATPVALYIIHQLVENGTNSALYQNVDWYILPNLNPDGYEFTQTNDRLWRKNRRLTPGASCYGTDLNRNFDYFWMHDGASMNSCTEIHAGPQPFSEPESQAINDWFEANSAKVKLYLTIHSFGEWMLYPWGYAQTLPEDHETLQHVGELFANAIRQASTIGSNYVVNTSALALYPAAGGSDDWVKGIAGVNLSYTIELPAGDSPFFFMLPARQILPVVQETWEGIKALHAYIEDTFWRRAHN